MDNLTHEIVKRILNNIGINLTSKKHGLYDFKYLLNKKIKVKYKDKIVEHDMYAGKISYVNFTIKSLIIDMSIDSNTEYFLIYMVDNLPIVSIHHSFNEDRVISSIQIFDGKNSKWFNTNMYMKAQALSAFEQLTFNGMLWTECHEIDELYNASKILIDHV